MLKALLYLLFFFLPTQLGRHFWFDWSYKLGMRADYLSPTIYFTDLLALVIIVVFFGRMAIRPYADQVPSGSLAGGETPPLRGKSQRAQLILCCFIGLLMVGWWLFVVGENQWLLLYNLGRLGGLGLLGYVIAKTFKKKDFPRIINVLNWALILQVFLAGYQVVVERSADLWILGERSFSIATPGIARFIAPGGQLLLRGYGTFPHPNVLGGFCLLMLAANTILFLRNFTPGIRKSQISNLKSQINSNFQNLNDQKNVIFYIVGFGFSLLGIWLSMSVLAIVLSQVFLVGVGAWWVMRAQHALPCRQAGVSLRGRIMMRPYIILLLIIPLVILVSGIWYQVSGNSDSVSRRITLIQYSWEMFKTSPIFGVGLGNFVPAMPEKPIGSTYFWQPVHNIPALVGVELGLAGIAIVGLLIWKLLSNVKCQMSNVKTTTQMLNLIVIFWLVVVFITGLFDHYWLTLQQGRLMLVMVVGLSFVGASSSKKLKR